MIFRNRFFRWTGFFLLGLLALVFLFYAEEDLRGWHAWNQFKKSAKGERFDYASVVPPKVPDDDNFALAPVVVSCYRQQLDTNGKRVLARDTTITNRLDIDLYGGADTKSRPTNGNWSRGIPTDLAAWQRFYRTSRETTHAITEFPVAPAAQSPAADVLLALSTFDPVIEDLREAAQRPSSRFPLNYDAEYPFITLLPHLANLKRCALVLQLRASAELDAGQTDKALDDVKLSFRLISATRDEPFLISHLVRAAQLQLVFQPIWEGMNRHQWSDAQLAAIQQELAQIDFVTDCQKSMHGSRNGVIAVVDHLRRHRSFRELTSMFSGSDEQTVKPGDFFKAVAFRLMPGGWFYQNEVAIASLHQQRIFPAIDASKHQIFPRITDRNEKSPMPRQRSLWNYFGGAFLPAMASAERKFAQAQATADLARIACALERFRLANGHYPASLDALSPSFIDPLPTDVIGGDAFRYRLTSDGTYLLYSVGWNGIDDDGKPGLRRNDVQDLTAGDWVWLAPGR